MKMSSSILLPALALLFLSLAATRAAPVLDIEGNPLENNGAYHIYPRGPYGTGGLTLKPVNQTSLCPLSIKRQLYSIGLPVTISSPVRLPFLTTGLRLSLNFNNFKSACNDALQWWVSDEDKHHHRYVIVGVDSGEFESSFFFKIEEAASNENGNKYVYNIKFCHVSESSIMSTLVNVDEECDHVGLIDGLLGITPNEPFDVVFIKRVAKIIPLPAVQKEKELLKTLLLRNVG